MVPDLIFDIGMHEGADTAYYLAKGFRVVAVDANPALCEAARSRFSAEIKYGRLTVLNVGIAEEVGELDFYICKDQSDWSSFIPEYALRAGATEVIRIRCITLDMLMRDFGVPYFCKIDIEGSDRAAVMALRRLDNFPRYVSVEATVGDFCDIMSALGYGGFKIINQYHIASVLPISPPLEGCFCDAKIVPGLHSGPFGDESYGRWLTPEEFTEEYRRLREKDFYGSEAEAAGVPFEQYHRWCDFHAKLGPI